DIDDLSNSCECRYYPAHASSLDKLAAALPPLAARNLHQWRSQPGSATSVVVPDFPVDWFCVRGTCLRIHPDIGHSEEGRSTRLCIPDRSRSRVDLSLEIPGLTPITALSRLRLLALESDFLHDSSRNAAAADSSRLRLVPLGLWSARLQPTDSAGEHFPAGVLGTHRVRLRTLQHTAPPK